MNVNFRGLYEQILDYEGANLFNDVLSVWVNENQSIHADFDEISRVNPLAMVYPSQHQSWALYALSKILDTLTLGFQPDRNADKSGWSGPALTLSEYVDFATLLGLESVMPDRYSSFHCEIMEATEGGDAITLSKVLYPTLMLKDLLIGRAGVIVSCNPHTYNVPVVNNSTIYWTYRRKNRKFEDLSQGWGHNSRWRTNFRFDYDLGDSFLYNATGEIDLNRPTSETLNRLAKDNLNLEEAIELTVNRHFLTSSKKNDDLLPYDYKYLEKKDNSSS